MIRSVDIKDKLPFVRRLDDVIKSNEETRFWKGDRFARADGVRVRALFLDQPTGPVLQMIGTKYVFLDKLMTLSDAIFKFGAYQIQYRTILFLLLFESYSITLSGGESWRIRRS